MKKSLAALVCAINFYSGLAWGEALEVPIPLDYPLIRQVLMKQLYTAPGQVAHLWGDKRNCRFLNLSQPQLAGVDGEIKLSNNVAVRLGTALGGQCLTLLEWSGRLETFQKPTLNQKGTALRFPVTRIDAYDGQGRAVNIAELQDLLKKVVAPKLAEVKIDLKQSREDMNKTLATVVPDAYHSQLNGVLDSLRFNTVTADSERVLVNIGLEAPAGSEQLAARLPAEAFDAAEMQQWQQLWQHWERDLTKTIQSRSSGAMRGKLLGLLKEAHSVIKTGLTADNEDENDPVRGYFKHSWDTLAPALRELAQQAEGVQGLRYLSFIAGADMLYELDKRGAPLGIGLSSSGLRRLARLLIAEERR